MISISSVAALIAAIAAIVPGASATSSAIIPCNKGQGPLNGCGGCSNSSAIALTPYDKATTVENFSLIGAEASEGSGFDVYWSVGRVDPSCRVLLMTPFTQETHNPNLAGNVVLSVAHPGCYFAHVQSNVSAAFCCGTGDCTAAGAAGVAAAPSKRSVLNPYLNYPTKRISSSERRSRMVKAKLSVDQTEDDSAEARVSATASVEKRWGGGQPVAPTSTAPPFTCSTPVAMGDAYTKAGAQQINGNTLSCVGGESCNQSPSMATSVSDSITNENSLTVTNTQGVSVSVTAGMNWPIGPVFQVTAGYSADWSRAVAQSLSLTKDTTNTKTLMLNVGLKPGSSFNLWFTPTLNCQKFTLTCNGQDATVEKCSPAVDGAGNPVGDNGPVSIG